MKKITNKILNNLPIVVLLIFCGIMSFQMCFSPFAQGHGHGYDSAIYAAIGNALNNGRVLYTGIVDNKGPLLYFIDALGLSINYHFGIFLIECIFLFVGIVFAYKTAKLITKNKKWLSCFSAIFATLLLVYTLDGGNYTEEYAIFFINIATYFVIKFLLNEYKLAWYELLIIGMCFAATFLLRANLCAFFVSQVLVILVCLIKGKKFKVLFRSMGYILLGILIFLTPFLIYLIKNGALSDCLNLVYFGVVNSFEQVSWLEKFTKMCGLIEIADAAKIFSVALLAFILFLTRPKMEKSIKRIMIIAFMGLLLNLYVNSLTGGEAWAFTHYFISFIPIIVIISAYFFNYIYESIKELKISNEIKNIIIILLAFTVIAPQTLDLLETSIKRIEFTYPEPSAMEQYILDNSTEKDTIQIIGVNDAIYYPVNRISTSKHLYFAENFSERKRKSDANELVNDLYKAENPAKIIMLPSGEIDKLTFTMSLENRDKFIGYLNKNYTLDVKASEQFNCNVYLLNNTSDLYE